MFGYKSKPVPFINFQNASISELHQYITQTESELRKIPKGGKYLEDYCRWHQAKVSAHKWIHYKNTGIWTQRRPLTELQKIVLTL